MSRHCARRENTVRGSETESTIKPDLCVIGAGSGGLSVAAAAAQFGVPVVLIEKGRMGGDCLNYGCVPSKSLLAAAKLADLGRHGSAVNTRASPRTARTGLIRGAPSGSDAAAIGA